MGAPVAAGMSGGDGRRDAACAVESKVVARTELVSAGTDTRASHSRLETLPLEDPLTPHLRIRVGFCCFNDKVG